MLDGSWCKLYLDSHHLIWRRVPVLYQCISLSASCGYSLSRLSAQPIGSLLKLGGTNWIGLRRNPPGQIGKILFLGGYALTDPASLIQGPFSKQQHVSAVQAKELGSHRAPDA
jgi:hypothetical protein